MTLPVGLAVVVGVLQWNSSLGFRASRQEVFHVRTTLLAMQDYASTLKDAETGQRGYLLTGKESYLEPYLSAQAECGPAVQNLRQLFAGNAEQEKNLDVLETLANAKLGELAQTVALEKSGDHAGALQIVQTDFGMNTMDQFRLKFQEMERVENKLFAHKEASYEHRSQVNLILSAILLGFGFLLIVIIIGLLRRVEKYQDMVKICAWSKMIEYEGEWLSVEDYLGRRLHAKVTHGMSEVEASKMLKEALEQSRESPGL